MTKSNTILSDFELDYTEEAQGLVQAVRPDLVISVQGEGGKVFHRRAIKITKEGVQEPVSMLVARLPLGYNDAEGNPVHASLYYVEGGIILSKEDLYL